MQYAPTPFSPDQIRLGCIGRRIVTRTEGPGVEPTMQVIEYLAADATAAVVVTQLIDAAGNAVGDPEEFRPTWVELEQHALFPADTTIIAAETIESPLGVLDTSRYTVSGPSGTLELWFAHDFPGMPVRFQSRAGGTVTSTTTVIESRIVDEPTP